MRMSALVLALPLMACGITGNGDDDRPGIAPTGAGTTRSYAAADFSKVALVGADDADVRVGTGYSVRAEGPSEQLDMLRISRDGDTLRIDRKRSGIGWSRGGGKVRIFVTVPRLAGATVAGSGNLTIDRIEGASFTGSVAGSGNLDVGGLAVDAATIEMAGSGNVTAKGVAKQIDISIAGSGDVDAKQLAAGGASVSIAGSGGVTATVNGPAEVSIMGSGDVDLGPGAKCSTSKMGSGKVRCG